MLNGFVVGGKYVVEEKLVGGRLLCHDIGAEGNKRVIPLGVRIKNKLYLGTQGSGVSTYEGVKTQVYNNSIITCCSDSEGIYFEGIFYSYNDITGFTEGGIYIFDGLDVKGNLLVRDSQSHVAMRIPKGVVFSPDEYNQWVYDGSNTKMPGIGHEIWCTSIKEDVVFVGEFEKIDGTFNIQKMMCPKCNYNYSSKCTTVSVEYSGVFRSGVISELFSKYVCNNCGAVILKADERLGSICISDVSGE